MNVVLISQCSKRALPATRRILDQFAERKGSRTWLTPITEAGLETLYGLLRRGARRNTAVSCHIVRGGDIELLWIVGNRRRFDERGNVPTDSTAAAVLDRHREDGWRHTEAIAVLASIAGLFHDFGKANRLFQTKLSGAREARSEPLRHEWVSLRLFEAFVGGRPDGEWLEHLGTVSAADEKTVLKRLLPDVGDTHRGNPLSALEGRPVAWVVGWLICTHHRLPVPPYGESAPRGGRAERWKGMLRPSWISPQFTKGEGESEPGEAERWTKAELDGLWRFPAGLPWASTTWRARAASASRRALRLPNFVDTDWTSMPFVLHLARCALMLADHHYSASAPTEKWRDPEYGAAANTEPVPESPGERRAKQRLDEHCVGVSINAHLTVRSLPLLRAALPAIDNVRRLRERSKGRFAWQNRAFELAERVAENSRRRGGFVVNMASTGTGKTLANARIAHGLSKGGAGVRFTVLLGLRALTLQTSGALRERLRLAKSDLATLVGAPAVRELYEREAARRGAGAPESGSESATSLFAEHEYVRYDGALEDSRVGRWLRGDREGSRLHRLISAPVLVGTIDHVMPATESARGGHQIAPMLRLLTSDLVLDEPDDFDLGDLPALCRLTCWAGMLGSRVVVSSATLPPSLLENLFDAYLSGRRTFGRATQELEEPVVCGWVDEFSSHAVDAAGKAEFARAHETFVTGRVARLASGPPPRRWTRLADVPLADGTTREALADVLRGEILFLHRAHGQVGSTGHRVSVGVVRMANIDPLVETVTALARGGGFGGAEVHLCAYHARHPLRRRAAIEAELDSLLDRTVPERFWTHPAVRAACARPTKDQIFVVVATSVAEVGRDHDYDWAVIEPSSMRSILQLCGRVLRHRTDVVPDEPNVVLLGRNLRGLAGRVPSFFRPGYETSERTLVSRDLADVLPPEQRERPSLASRIEEDASPRPAERLVDLEHVVTREKLEGEPARFAANLWWEKGVDWCYVLQRQTPFRAGMPTDTYALVAEDEAGPVRFERLDEGAWKARNDDFEPTTEPEFGPGVRPWPDTSDVRMLAELAGELDVDAGDPALETACRRYLSVELPRYGRGLERWRYHWWLGVHRPVSEPRK